MSNSAESWQKGQPIAHRLPGENSGYRKDEDWEEYDPELDPPIARWLEDPWDKLLMDTKAKIDGFPTNYLYPDSAYESALDWLAQFCGYTGDYWSSSWPISVKRTLLIYSYSFVWENKGTRRLLEWLFSVFALQVRVYLLGEWLAGITRTPGQVGGEPFRYYLLVRLQYLRTSPEWALISRLNRLFGPVYAKSRLSYEYFYAGFSVAGDPTFTYDGPTFGSYLLEDGWRLLTEDGFSLSLDYAPGLLLNEDGSILLVEDGSLFRVEDPVWIADFLLEDGDRLLIEDGRVTSTALDVLLLESGNGWLLENGEDYLRLE